VRHATLRSIRVTGPALILALLVCLPAAAQRPRPDRPYRGLFGGNGADPNSSQLLDVSVSLSGAYDDNVLAESNPSYTGDPRFQQSGGYGAGSISLDYTKRAGKADVDFTGGTSYRYYPSIEEMTGFNSWGSVGFTVRLSSRTTFSATESVAYSPFYSFSAFPGNSPQAPGGVVPIVPEYPLAEEAAISVYSSASFEHRLTPRSSLTADYVYTSTDYRSRDLPFRDWGAGGTYAYRFNSRAGLHLGYHFRRGVSGLYYGDQPIDSHNIDVGIDYSRALSSSRKTTFGFSTGTAIYRTFEPDGSGTGTPGYRDHYLITAHANLNRQIGRSWTAGLYYVRDMQYVQGFGDPFFYDTVTAGVTGFAGPRSRVNLGVSYSRGAVGAGISVRNYDTVMGIANYQFGLTKWAALFASYSYYYYLFDDSVPIPARLSRGQSRNSISGGVNLWSALLR
jgi:hypothetical protein